MSKFIMLFCLTLAAVPLWSQPLVDGIVQKSEYQHAIKALDGTATISYSVDAKGGLNIAVAAKTSGWVGLGLGSQVMDGAYIFMGYVRNGKTVFSEQKGSGHQHTASTVHRADTSSVRQTGGITTIEFHVQADKLPFKGKKFDYIVASAGAPNLTAFHEDSIDGGSISLP